MHICIYYICPNKPTSNRQNRTIVDQIIHERQDVTVAQRFQRIAIQIQHHQSRYAGERTTFQRSQAVVLQVQVVQIVQSIECPFVQFLLWRD